MGRFDLSPERPEVELHIDPGGAITQATAARWGPLDEGGHDYVQCGCEVHSERGFGGLTIPSRLTVSWEFGTPRQAPYLRAEITGAEQI